MIFALHLTGLPVSVFKKQIAQARAGSEDTYPYPTRHQKARTARRGRIGRDRKPAN